MSDRVAVEAVRLLAAEGFVESKSGSGSYVRRRPERQRLTRSWYTSRQGGSPFRAAMSVAGIPGTWESSTERVPMTPAIAARLGAEPGEAAMRTIYTFFGDARPMTLSVSWEPGRADHGHRDHAARGRPARREGRRGAHGRHRPADHSRGRERGGLRLGIRPGGTVLTIARTYHTAECPVETADIVIPVERYSFVYEVAVG